MFTDLPSVSQVLTRPRKQTSLMLKLKQTSLMLKLKQTSLMLKLRNVHHSGLLSDITPTDAKKGP